VRSLPRIYTIKTQSKLDELRNKGIDLVCLVCDEEVGVGDEVKPAYGYRGRRKGKLRHTKCLNTARKEE